MADLNALSSSPQRKCLIDAFVEGRLLVTGIDATNRPTLQVAHEALFLHWPRLVTLLEANLGFPAPASPGGGGGEPLAGEGTRPKLSLVARQTAQGSERFAGSGRRPRSGGEGVCGGIGASWQSCQVEALAGLGGWRGRGGGRDLGWISLAGKKPGGFGGRSAPERSSLGAGLRSVVDCETQPRAA